MNSINNTIDMCDMNNAINLIAAKNIYDEMLQKISIYKDTHPNLYQIWYVYLTKLKDKHEGVTKQFDLIMNAMPNNPDISNSNILMLYAYNIASNTN
jgi:hypothetical protein